MVERSRNGKSTSGLFAITVDDGEGDNVRALSQLFLAKQWPASFYLPTHYVDTGTGMMYQWWRRVKPLLPRRQLELRSGVLNLSSPGAVDALSRKMEWLWHTQRLECYLPLTMDLVELVERETGLKRAAIRPEPPISWPEVEALSKSDLIGFESHGVSHAAMSSLTEEELVFEMRHSRDRVAEHTGRPCRHLAYPFGSPPSIGAQAAATAAQFYDSAVTMSLGHVGSANPWLLPRIPLYPENSLRFARLKILLKCRTFGPAEGHASERLRCGCTGESGP
ncbi:MAG TPA: polysaccharide deacetylase family protein [Bryobacteraceae bacterium]|nr:polysaccharide deacetylase family protein [Bryobacteraceae bacterium]